MRRRLFMSLMMLASVAFACGKAVEQSFVDDDDAGAMTDASLSTDVVSDATTDVVLHVSDAGARDVAVEAANGRDGSSSLCLGLDAASVLLCETFDNNGMSLPPAFLPDAASNVAARIEIASDRALSPPSSAHVYFTDAGDYSSANGAAVRATLNVALPRAHVSFAVFIDGSFNGEVDVLQLTWSSPTSPSTPTYWFRFGTNSGLFWTFESTGYGLLSPTM